MKIILKTNIDAYNGGHVVWPTLSIVPRVGEQIRIHPISKSYCDSKQIPHQLTVDSVTYTIDGVEVDLWFSKNMNAGLVHRILNQH